MIMQESYVGQHDLIQHTVLKVGHLDLTKSKLGTLGFQGCTLLVLHPKSCEIGHIDLITCNGLKYA